MTASPFAGVLVDEDIPVDAALVKTPAGETVLMLRPGQTFGSAVAAVAAVAPSLPLDKVRGLVREHLPDALQLDDLIGAPEVTVIEEAQTDRYFLPPVAWLVIGLVLASLVAAFIGIHAAAKNDGVWTYHEHRGPAESGGVVAQLA